VCAEFCAEVARVQIGNNFAQIVARVKNLSDEFIGVEPNARWNS
jgi:hypothetical protein